MNAVLEGCKIPSPDQIRLGRQGVNELRGACELGLAEIIENVMVDQRFLAGVSDAEPQAMEIRTDMGLDRAQAIMSGVTAAGLGADLAERQIQLVVKNDNMAWGDDDGKTLYLCAQSGLYKMRLNIPGIRP